MGSLNRQDFLLCALDWVSRGNISDYMSRHRHNTDITELKTYFNSVIDWASSVFIDVTKEMRGLAWGELYEQYHKNSYNPLGGERDIQLLDIRIFDEPTKQAVYKRQSTEAVATGFSNCPLCALGRGRNYNKIRKQSEMEADHVTAWINGGSTDILNCQMPCKTHNRAKGNR